jgi:hypothetical protein
MRKIRKKVYWTVGINSILKKNKKRKMEKIDRKGKLYEGIDYFYGKYL